MSFPPCPKEIKPVAHLLKLAVEHDNRNIVVAYWARMAAVHLSLKIVPGKKPPEVNAMLTALLDWLEKTKQENLDNDGITSEAAAQAIIEEYALNLFAHGDQQDRAEIFNKNTVKTFYTAGMLMDVLDQFGLSEDIQAKRKYAKWKAAYIHNCLKSSDTPIPGAPGEHLNNVVRISDLTDEDRAIFEEEKRKMEEQEGKDADNIFNLPSVPKLDDNMFAPAPASSPVTPSIQPHSIPISTPTIPLVPISPTGVALTPDQIQKAQKYCKYATSALNYDDIQTAIGNLQKALLLLQSGKEE